ncbi:MAG: hypothetical protein WA783_04860 [Phormidesmis sp.]
MLFAIADRTSRKTSHCPVLGGVEQLLLNLLLNRRWLLKALRSGVDLLAPFERAPRMAFLSAAGTLTLLT